MTTQTKPSEQLLALIEELRLPICPEDTMDHLKGLTEEEIETLLPSFEYVQGYHESLSKEAKKANPERYSTENEAFEKELHELRKDYLKTAEEVQKKYDDEADAIDLDADAQISKKLSELAQDTQVLEESFDDLNEKIVNSASA